MNPTKRALIIEPNPLRSKALSEAIDRIGVGCQVTHNAKEGWRAFARYRPTHVFAAIRPDDKESGDFFLRKLHSEFIGTMPRTFLTADTIEIAYKAKLEPSAYIIWPLSFAVLQDLFSEHLGAEEAPRKQITRLRDLYELTVLGPDILQGLDSLVLRMALGFQSTNGLIWGPEQEQHWPRSAQPLARDEWPALRRQCTLASQIPSTLLVSEGAKHETIIAGQGRSILAAPLSPPTEEVVAGICLISENSRHFSCGARDDLVILAKRLTSELAWFSAHNRLVAEHEQLRQTALLDPMLGVWSRSAFQQEIAKAILSQGAKGASLTIALFDFKHLRSVNDRYGHSVGDAVLTHFASALQSHLSPQDQLGRFGGDELIALFSGLSLSETKERASKITYDLGLLPFQQKEISVRLDIRSGVAQIKPDESTSEGAFARALSALDQASNSRIGVVAVENSPELGDVDIERQDELISLGATLGGMYRIIHEISRGAMGIVYRGEDLGLGRPVAIKLLRADLSSDSDLVSKFRSEAALLASLRHPNLVQVYSFGTENDAVYFVMELVEGEPISQIARRLAKAGEYININAVATIVEEIAEALDAIHALGIVHRDVKPENVLIDRINDRAVLVDVGIAKRVGDARDAAGTPGYAAPESFMEADETPSTDVYGLAATAYAMLTNAAPYSAKDLDALLKRQLTEPIAPPSRVRSELNTAVDKVLAKALDPKPKRRYQSANALAVALARALAKTPAKKKTSPPLDFPEAFTESPTLADIPISTYQIGSAVPASETNSIRKTRGAVFRVTSKVLGRRLGGNWLASISRADPVVGELLKPTLPPASWQSTTHLLWLLQCLPDHSDQPKAIARLLGATLASSTLAQFFGAELDSQATITLLRAAESFWPRYHSWGHITAKEHGATECRLTLEAAPNSTLLGEMLAGMFGHIPILTGADKSNCGMKLKSLNGVSTMSFVVQWRD